MRKRTPEQSRIDLSEMIGIPRERLLEFVSRHADTLTEAENTALAGYYAVYESRCETLAELGRALHVSHEAVRFMCHRAIEILSLIAKAESATGEYQDQTMRLFFNPRRAQDAGVSRSALTRIINALEDIPYGYYSGRPGTDSDEPAKVRNVLELTRDELERTPNLQKLTVDGIYAMLAQEGLRTIEQEIPDSMDWPAHKFFTRRRLMAAGLESGILQGMTVNGLWPVMFNKTLRNFLQEYPAKTDIAAIDGIGERGAEALCKAILYAGFPFKA